MCLYRGFFVRPRLIALVGWYCEIYDREGVELFRTAVYVSKRAALEAARVSIDVMVLAGPPSQVEDGGDDAKA